VTDFADTAVRLGQERGWSCFPTKLNSAGKAKLPALYPLSAFTRLTPDQNAGHVWESAAGIAVALGAPSGGLGLIDIDHPGLADYVLERLKDQAPLMCGTPRGLHVFTLGTPSLPRNLAVRHPGDARTTHYPVDLLSTGTYCVIPPCAGYWWINEHAEPLYGSVEEVWRRLALSLDMPYEKARGYHFSERSPSSSPRLTTREIRQALDVGG
jgi:hypothetical protein